MKVPEPLDQETLVADPPMIDSRGISSFIQASTGETTLKVTASFTVNSIVLVTSGQAPTGSSVVKERTTTPANISATLGV